jgi:hypothetical protein
MNEERIQELLKLNSNLSLDDATAIYNFEVELQNDKDLVIKALSRDILSEDEVAEKLNRCFQFFLRKTVGICGEEICKDIYDYVPGDSIGFLHQYKHREEEADGINSIEITANKLLQATKLLELSGRHNFELKKMSVASEHFSELSGTITHSVNRDLMAIRLFNLRLEKEAKSMNHVIANMFDDNIEITAAIDTIEEANYKLEQLSNKYLVKKSKMFKGSF